MRHSIKQWIKWYDMQYHPRMAQNAVDGMQSWMAAMLQSHTLAAADLTLSTAFQCGHVLVSESEESRCSDSDIESMSLTKPARVNLTVNHNCRDQTTALFGTNLVKTHKRIKDSLSPASCIVKHLPFLFLPASVNFLTSQRYCSNSCTVRLVILQLKPWIFVSCLASAATLQTQVCYLNLSTFSGAALVILLVVALVLSCT